MITKYILTLVRRLLLIILGSAAVQKIFGPGAVELLSDSFVGALMSVLGTVGLLLWSLLDRKVEDEKVEVAIAAPPTTTVEQVEKKVSVLKKIFGWFT